MGSRDEMGSPLAHTTGDQPCSLAKKKERGGRIQEHKKRKKKRGESFLLRRRLSRLFFFLHFVFAWPPSKTIRSHLSPEEKEEAGGDEARKKRRRRKSSHPGGSGKRRNKGNKRRRCFMLSLLSHPNHYYYSTMYSILPKPPESNPSGLSRPCLLLSFLPFRRFPLFFGKDISRARDGRGGERDL